MPTEPSITTSAAHVLSLTFGIIYVGSLYLSKNARLSFSTAPIDDTKGNGRASSPRLKQKDEKWRDDPDVIRARLVAAGLATLVCCFLIFLVFAWHIGHLWRLSNLVAVFEATFVHLGLSLSSFNPSNITIRDLYSHLVTPILFLGPIYAGYLGNQLPGQRNWMWESHIIARFFSPHGVRNYWIGPITEEIVFRACVLSIYQLSGASKTRMIFFAPLTFGLAHVHHAWDTYNRYGRSAAAVKRAVISSLFQLSYTTLFGFHVSYLFLRTGSIFPPITAHICCNVMGVPELGWELRKYPRHRQSIIAAYLFGVIGFIYTLGKWTETSGNIYWIKEGGQY